MSIPVDLEELESQLRRFGPSAILVTTSVDGPPHVSSVLVSSDGGELSMSVGRRTRTNAQARPEVALVWNGSVDDDYCLIVDGAAHDVALDPGLLVVRPTSAVLHRVAHASTDVPRCLPLKQPPAT